MRECDLERANELSSQIKALLRLEEAISRRITTSLFITANVALSQEEKAQNYQNRSMAFFGLGFEDPNLNNDLKSIFAEIDPVIAIHAINAQIIKCREELRRIGVGKKLSRVQNPEIEKEIRLLFLGEEKPVQLKRKTRKKRV